MTIRELLAVLRQVTAGEIIMATVLVFGGAFMIAMAGG